MKSKRHLQQEQGMTLIETLVAVSILAVAIVAPMSLTMQSLASAYYARDQVVMFNLAQEAIESVRGVRDGNILRIALNQPDPTCNPTSLLCNIPLSGNFMIDTRVSDPQAAITPCDGVCDYLQTDPEQKLYGYQSGWTDTPYRRTITTEFVPGSNNDEIRITVVVTSDAGSHPLPPVTLKSNLYKWVEDGSGI